MKHTNPFAIGVIGFAWFVSTAIAQTPDSATVLSRLREADDLFARQFTIDAVLSDPFPPPLPTNESERLVWRVHYTRDGAIWAYDATIDPKVAPPKNVRRLFFRTDRRRALIEPDFNGTHHDIKVFRIQPDGSLQTEAGGPEARLDRPSTSPPFGAITFQIPWTAGRGFSAWIDQIKTVSMDPATGLLHCDATQQKTNRPMELVIDPGANYLVRSAGLHLGRGTSGVSDEFITDGILQTPMGMIAQHGSYTIRLDVLEMKWEFEFQYCKPGADAELITSNRALLRTGKGLANARVTDRTKSGR